ncbi:MerR family transcriptional regulator [Allofranklinella schreckenbergeri]|uniref:MerR family transcriptional regulator n=1 Tax=Allofranklinella schreckenbergeri TaxID=1076744 RepID=A0A3M6R533_9BURK|nr:MerR family transcriptional regulator [Allofranklinella schreckenbergeri]RMX02120.1 MerR family transcriptional regulator [Allofranklinella schreckenbergeri]RMX10214.1 MerR family transcriptional regulator [Allofranklinella schreckenbergeri]
MNNVLPPIPAKRYFTIGEVAELCDVKPHVLRYWEQEFTQLRPMKRRGNRRYYQHHEVLMIRRIRELLYGQGFTISGARSRLQDWHAEPQPASAEATPLAQPEEVAAQPVAELADEVSPQGRTEPPSIDFAALRSELFKIRAILVGEAIL